MALTAKTRERHPPEEIQRRLREIAYRRLLHRLFKTQPKRWILKGGVSLLLRLDPNRASNDIYLAYVVEDGEHAVALEAVVEAAAYDAEDFFGFDIGRTEAAEVDPDHPLERVLSVPVTARLGRAVFAQFSIDLALARDDVDAEWIAGDSPLTGTPEVDDIGPIAALKLPAQLADKLCALFERHGEDGHSSSRARDLADIAMIASQEDVDGTELHERVRQEEHRRLDAGTLRDRLPQQLQLDDEQVEDWRRRWVKATRAAPIVFEEAYELSAALIDPVLQDQVAGRRWVASETGWQG